MAPDLKTAIDASFDNNVKELARLVEIPSVSAQDLGIRECLDVVVELLEARGLKTEVHETPGKPMVIATGGVTAQDAPTLLFYEHYDVQPPDPLDEWTVEPFAVTPRDGCLFGRGVADTKGHIISRLAAIDAIREVHGGDRIAYKFLIEGEEEIGSPNLEPFIEKNRELLKADACIWEFGGVSGDGQPVISLGLKGIATFELRAKVPSYDIHSSLGAVIDNPLYLIASAVASLRDSDGRVLVDGFYDDVRPPTELELSIVESSPDQTQSLKRTYELDSFLGDVSGADLTKRLELSPCVNVNGIHGGYGGKGSKTVVPSEAFAKLDFRLVPNQRPDRIKQLLIEHLKRVGLERIEVIAGAGEAPGRTSPDDPFAKLCIDAGRRAYGKEPLVQVSSAGTGPAHPFEEYLKVPFACVGIAYPGSRIHAPDEHVRVDDFKAGNLHTAYVIEAMEGFKS